MHLSKPRRGLGRWESLSRILPSLVPSSILLQAAPDIYLAVRQERQCKSNPPPINYLFHSPFSSLSLYLSTPFCLPPNPPFSLLPLHLPSSFPPPQHAASHCNINLAVRGAVAMWQTCHCNGQLDKCRGVAERCGPHTIPPPCYPRCTEERRAGDARRRKGKEE